MPGRRVRRAILAQNGDAGPQGPAGQAGPPGTARAFGVFETQGELVAGKNLTIPGGGDASYCVVPDVGSGIDPATTAAVVTAGGEEPAFATVDSSVAGCPGWLVRTFQFMNVGGSQVPVNQGIGFRMVVH